jgi:hypothetical protein
MKKLAIVFGFAVLCLAVASMAVAAAAPAPAQSWTGWITDSHCGVKGANDKHTKDCAAKCVKEGSKVQFVNDTDKKVYDIDKAHWDEAMGHVGHKVTVTGAMDKGAITVAKIEMPAPAK